MADRLRTLDGRERTAAGFAAVLVLITVGWWALALWPLASGSDGVLARARYVCFGVAANGLPDGSGWLALVLQPLLMFGLLSAMSGDALRAAARKLGARPVWRATGATAMTVAVGLIVIRLAGPAQAEPVWTKTVVTNPDRPVPEFSLLAQTGREVTRESLLGRSWFVTFAFGHCETVCPVIVRDVQNARRALGPGAPGMIVVTLDPWRDVPSRLESIATHWELGPEEFVLSGSVDDVEAALDAWQVPRARNERTGDVVHPRLVYLVDARSRIVVSTNAGTGGLVAAVQQGT